MLGIGRDPHEIEVLHHLLVDKIRSSREPLSSTTAPLENLSGDAQTAFVEFQFKAPMRNYTRWAGWYGFAFTVLSLAALVAGLASSGIAAGWSDAPWARWTILVLGLVAAVSAVITQVWRPGQKASSRAVGGNALRREAWDYLNDLGKYEELQPDARFSRFAVEVSAIVRAAEAVDEQVPSTPVYEPAKT